MKHRAWSRLSLWLPACLFLAACQNLPSKEANERPDPLPLQVGTARVRRMTLVDTLTIFGRVALRQEAFLAAQFDGRLSGFSLLLGDRVEKDQLVGVLVPAAREALLQVAGRMPAEQRALLERQIKEMPLHSPMGGVVLDVYRHTGDVVQKGEQILRIGDLSVLDIRGDVPVRYLPAVKRLSAIRADFIEYPHEPLSLPVEAFSGAMNAENQTLVMRLRLDNPKREFRPGMLVKLSAPAARHAGALTIPRAALLENAGIYTVFVLNGAHVEQRTVLPGLFQGDRVEILSGLEDRETVITEKAYSLEDGMEVKVK